MEFIIKKALKKSNHGSVVKAQVSQAETQWFKPGLGLSFPLLSFLPSFLHLPTPLLATFFLQIFSTAQMFNKKHLKSGMLNGGPTYMHIQNFFD